jgi:hypothetical protein
MKNDISFIRHHVLCIIAFGLVTLLVMGVIQSYILSATAETKKIATYMITTRDLQKPGYEGVQELGYGNNYSFLNISQLMHQPCPNEITIFVHGWGQNETQAKERLDRVKLSMEKNNYTHPLVGFSWPSDTVWLGAQFIAKENGPKLGKFILDIKSKCHNPDNPNNPVIRIIGHSLGARVILSSLDWLHKNNT